MNDITVIYATDHNFVFITAVSVYSLAFNYKGNRGLNICLLIDQSVTESDKCYFSKIENDFSKIKISYQMILSETLEEADLSYTYVNKMTLYRLMLPEVLSGVDKCIYLDADTLVRGDISTLAETNMENYYLAGVWDMGIDSFTSKFGFEELPDRDTYINAGVLVMNLELMRKTNLQKVLISKIHNKYPFSDQDILNICCYGHIKLLPEKYNYFSYRDEFNFDTVISHFLTWPGLRPWIYIKAKHADEWWEYASYFKDTEAYRSTRSAAEREYNFGSLKYILKQWKKHQKIYIWGATGFSHDFLERVLSNGAEKEKLIGFIDGNKQKQGNLFGGCVVYAPDCVQIDENTLVICTARQKKSMQEIEDSLLKCGCKESQMIFYKERERGFYTHIDPVYLQEEMNEVFYWKYGKVTKLG